MQGTAKTVRKCTSSLREKVISKKEIEINVQLDLQPSFAQRYVNYSRYVFEAPALKNGKLKNSHSN